ncbi:COP9 signalosome complex subunit 5-like [Schistocerca gregaria]|uniref:COP9 signalosome complex subunit 5-like n=1 Tax=Schistocerca gregaria TaxID=7010 RepID=UPI00211F32BE|nr:COP9 signalosome complex subunit 5-like [Schistocerca gregaria]
MEFQDSEKNFSKWQDENEVVTLKADDIYFYDEEAYSRTVQEAPWWNDPHYFKCCKISAVALLKMVMHAKSGGSLEVMGIMQGRLEPNGFVIMDSFPLPVEATEVRVNAGAEAYEYMFQHLNMSQKVSRTENAVGWYHSHPGYGCWLSGIDVNTQMQNQQFQDPWVAVVIDPIRTISSGKVEIGAFRTYPKTYKFTSEGSSEYQSIPLEKIEDFGVHSKYYYQLEIILFKSSLDRRLLDLLWNKYWVNSLSTSPNILNKDFATAQFNDLAEKLNQAKTCLAQTTRFTLNTKETQLKEIAKNCNKTSVEQINAVVSQIIKYNLFKGSACNDQAS